MEWLKSKTTMIAGGCLAIIGLQGYGMMSLRNTIDQRVSSIEHQLQTVQDQDNSKMVQLASELETVTKRMGMNAQELDDAHALAQRLKQENAQATQRLRRELSSKADAKSVSQLRDEANSKLSAFQQDADAKFAGVNGDVQGVRSDLNATREDLANSKKDLGTLIARNSTELAELRRRGDRDYTEFDIKKTKDYTRIADILVQLKKTDPKRQKFDVVINADDSNILKKDRTANEPVTFLVGHDRVRYEFVVNYVDKDRIRGYISTPKDKLLAAENPSLRRLQQ
jgi:phosphoenolpyruvate synthase/pyruvate phosphate dikinase